jgi:hypothetical protein
MAVFAEADGQDMHAAPGAQAADAIADPQAQGCGDASAAGGGMLRIEGRVSCQGVSQLAGAPPTLKFLIAETARHCPMGEERVNKAAMRGEIVRAVPGLW